MVPRNSKICEVSIPNSVIELGDQCFRRCRKLLRVIFGASSSLERIGVGCFRRTGICEVSIPDSVIELCDQCFLHCHHLEYVMIRASSSLERIGCECFGDTLICAMVHPITLEGLVERGYVKLFMPLNPALRINECPRRSDLLRPDIDWDEIALRFRELLTETEKEH